MESVTNYGSSPTTMVTYRSKNDANKMDVFVKNKQVCINTQSNEYTPAVLMLYDQLGRLMHRQQVFLTKGTNQTNVDVHLPEGVYIVKIVSSSRAWSQRFLYNP